MSIIVDYLHTSKSGIQYYRRKFPKSLVAYIPSAGRQGGVRAIFKRSLRTKTAKVSGFNERYFEAQREFDGIVAEAELKKDAHAKRAAGMFDELDAVDIATLAARYHAQELADDEARRRSVEGKENAREATRLMRKAGFEFSKVPEAAEWTLSIRTAHETIREAARAMRAYGDMKGIVGYWGDAALTLASQNGRELQPGGASHLALCEALHDAAVTASEEALRRLDGDLVPTPPISELTKRTRVAPPASRTLGDLIGAFKADRADKWSTSASRNFVPVERLMREVLGSEMPLADINRERGRELFDTVKRLPKGMGTLPALRNVSVAKALELGLPRLSPKSINGTYLSTMKAMFKFALQEQWMVAHPMLGLSVADPVHEADKRDPFTLDQLNTIFSESPWSPRDKAPRGKPLHFWGPLIALFHGMRRSEIAQLHVQDVTEVAGILVILVKSGGRKRTKTRNARRMLPVHPELLRLGFLDYVEQRWAAKGSQLWEGEKPNNTDQWGDGFSDWFGRQIKEHKFSGTRLGLHSFRHNFEDALREAELHGTALGAELAGRTKGGDTSNNYGSGYSTRQLADAMARIAYPGLII